MNGVASEGSVESRRGLAARDVAVLAAAAGLGAFVVAVLFLVDPGRSDVFPPCPFHALTGLYCPGCGSLRALHWALHRDFAGAFGLNPLMFLAMPVVIYELASHALLAVRGRALPRLFSNPLSAWIIFWVIVAYWILRNVPLYPMTLLAP